MTGTAGHRSTGAHPALRVLFVCTANISRSPYAELRARQALAGFGVEVSSAGTPGFPGRGMDPELERVLVERGGSADGHVSRSVTAELLEDADLVLPFEFAHHMRLLDAFPASSPRIIGLGQLAAAVSILRAAGSPMPSVDDIDNLSRAVVTAAGPNSMSHDVDDPHGRGPKVARACADEIDALLDRVLPLLAGRTLPPLAVPAKNPVRRPRWPWSRRPPGSS